MTNLWYLQLSTWLRGFLTIWFLQYSLVILSFTTNFLGQPFKLFIVMKYERDKNWLYEDWLSRIRGWRIIQVRNWKHIIKYLSVWFIKGISEWFPFFFFHYACYSKWGNCSTHLKSSFLAYYNWRQLIQSKKESTFFTHVAQLIEVWI